MNIRARMVIPRAGQLLEDAVVRVDGVRIAEVCPTKAWRQSGGKIDRDLGEVLLMPGLINAHCHLDYTLMRGALLGPTTFAEWIQRLNAIRRSVSIDDIASSISKGFQESARFGTTLVGNIESYPEVLEKLVPPPIRTIWFYELIDIRRTMPSEQLIEGALRFYEQHPGWLGGVGLSPHAPYTASLPLYQQAAETGRRLKLPMTTHLGESPEETEMFQNGRGPLFEFLSRIGRSMKDCGGGQGSPLRRLAEAGVLDRDWLVAHLNEIAEADWPLLEPGGPLSGLGVVHCPQSHEFFGHRPFSLERLVGAGCRVCLGTDSLATGRELNLFREMALAKKYHPRLRPERLLAMVTTIPAGLLGYEDRLGVLQTGAYADLTAVTYAGSPEDACWSLCDAFRKSVFTMCGGQIVFESHPA